MRTENLHTEGSRGVRDLCHLARELGYVDEMHRMQIAQESFVGDLLEFLEDNPGAIQVVYNWVDKNYPLEEEEEETEEAA